MHSIRTKIMAVTIAAVLTSILALGGLGILSIRKDSDQTALEKMNLISENMQQRLDAYFTTQQLSVDMAGRIAKDSLKGLNFMLFSASLSPEEQRELDAGIAAHCEAVEHAFSAIAGNTDGVVTYYYCINAELGSNEHGFFWSRMGGGDFVKQADLNSNDLDINDLEHTTWYYTPLKVGGPTWVGPYPAHYLNEELTLSYVVPIYYSGFLIGVMGMDILFETITQQLDTLRVYDTGHVYLMERNGDILYHPELPRGTTLAILGDKVFDSEILKHSSNGNELIRYTLNGVEKQLSFSTLRNKMKIGVTVPVSEITASQRRLSLVILMVAIAILAVFSVIILVLVRALTRPLLNLASASQQLSDGNYDVRLDYAGQDEVGTLTRTFQQMRDHLRYYIDDLNSRVYTDAMTGIRNKGAFTIRTNQLNNEIEKGEKPPEFGIILFDCNNLKKINDQYGHERGDIYLKTACQLICRIFAHSPVFRLGGDEFCVILQQDDYQKREELIGLFDRMARVRNSADVNPWEKISVAHGLAVFRPGEDQSADQVLSRADKAMYEHKNRSRHGAV